MTRPSIALAVTAALALSATAAVAQVTTTQSFGPGGYSASRTVHRGDMTVTRSMSRGPLGLHGCNTVTRVWRTAFRMARSSVRRCH